MDGENISKSIRMPEVNNQINPVAANPGVRKIMVKKQQELGRDGGKRTPFNLAISKMDGAPAKVAPVMRFSSA